MPPFRLSVIGQELLSDADGHMTVTQCDPHPIWQGESLPTRQEARAALEQNSKSTISNPEASTIRYCLLEEAAAARWVVYNGTKGQSTEKEIEYWHTVVEFNTSAVNGVFSWIVLKRQIRKRPR